MKAWKSWIMPTLVVVLAGVVAHDRLFVGRPVSPAASVNAAALGRGYAPVVVGSLSDAWLAAAQTVQDGKSVADAQKVLQETWQAARVKAFSSTIAPEFSKVLAEGTEPSTPEQRLAVAKLWREFARGLKGGR